MTQTIESNDINIPNTDKYFTFEDLQGMMRKGGKGTPVTKIYDPKTFWESMGEKFYRAFDKPEKCGFGVDFFVDRLKEFKPVHKLLEIGCGFGRLAPFLLQAKSIESYTGIEISDSIRKCAETYLNPDLLESTDADKINGFFSDGQISDETKNIVAGDVKAIVENLKKIANEKQKKETPDYRDRINLLNGDSRKLSFESDSFDAVISSEVLQHLNPDDAVKTCREMIRVSKNAIIIGERWAFPGEHSEPHIWSHNYSEIFTDLGLDILQVTTIAQGLQGVIVRKR